MPRTKTGPPLLVGVKGAAKTTTEGENKNNRKKRPKTPLPPRVQKKGPQKSTRRIPKTCGAQNGAPRKHQEAGRTAKKAEQTKAAGTQTRKKNKNAKCVWGCALLLPELSLLKRKRNENKKTTTSAKKPKEERKKPQNTRPDMKRIFQDSFGSEKKE